MKEFIFILAVLFFFGMYKTFAQIIISDRMAVPSSKSKQVFKARKHVEDSNQGIQTYWTLEYLVSYGKHRQIVFYRKDSEYSMLQGEPYRFKSQKEAELKAKELSKHALALGENQKTSLVSI